MEQSLLEALSPFIIELVLVVAAVFLLPKVYTWLKIKTDDSRRATIETALQNGLTFAVSTALGAKPDPTAVHQSKEEIIKIATEYVVTNVPDTLKKLGVDNAAIATLLQARLPAVIDAIRSKL